MTRSHRLSFQYIPINAAKNSDTRTISHPWRIVCNVIEIPYRNRLAFPCNWFTKSIADSGRPEPHVALRNNIVKTAGANSTPLLFQIIPVDIPTITGIPYVPISHTLRATRRVTRKISPVRTNFRRWGGAKVRFPSSLTVQDSPAGYAKETMEEFQLVHHIACACGHPVTRARQPCSRVKCIYL